MLIIALLGLGVNVASILILHGSHKEDLNVRSVFFHMIADAASSVGIVIAAVIITYTGWNILDPLVSFGISAVIVYWSFGILKESIRILLEMAPAGLNVDTIGDDLKNRFPEIKELSSAHLWTITPDILVFSAHLQLDTLRAGEDQTKLITEIDRFLSKKYGVSESTLQITSGTENEVCSELQPDRL